MDTPSVKKPDAKNPNYRDKLYTIDSKGNRNWVYPQIVWGKFLKLRSIVAYTLMIVYLIAPWIKYNGGSLILLNLHERKFTFFGADFWATDTIFFMFFLTSMGLILFLVTSILGRVWCGWACPETVFLEFLFRPIERLIEGSASQRKRLDESPWSKEKIFKKTLKHGISAFCAVIIANTALAYFIGPDKLIEVMTSSPAANPVLFSVMIILILLMGFQFGWFREQFCTVLCPYARFQSVMLDPDSLVIGYDLERGEPRGKVKDEEASGDCVDCKLCVRVCPTGIDIRNGLQLECINCSQCIDACDSIMDKVGRPRGLIRYDTERKLLGGARRFFRPRLVVYCLILAAYFSAFYYFLKIRTNFDFDVLREAKSSMFVESTDGRIMNQFKLRLSNKSGENEVFDIKIGGDTGEIQLISPLTEIEVKAGEIFDMPIFISVEKEMLADKGQKEVVLVAHSKHNETLEKTLNIIGPKKE